MTVSRATSERHCSKSIISPSATSQTIWMPPKCDGGPCGYVLCPGCDSSLDAFGSTSASCCLPILACLLTYLLSDVGSCGAAQVRKAQNSKNSASQLVKAELSGLPKQFYWPAP